MPAAASGISPASPAARPRCGATSASPIAPCCWKRWTPTPTAWTACAPPSRPRMGRGCWRSFRRRAGRALIGVAARITRPRKTRIEPVSAQPWLDLPAARAARGVVRLPGSKSISNRTLLLAALAQGSTEIRDLLLSDDTERMLQALAVLGVKQEKLEQGAWRIHGAGGEFPVKEAALYLGNAGTA